MKRRTKKLVALGMTAAMTAGLIAGCGKKATPESLLTDMAKNLAEVESLMANIGVGMEMTDGTDTMGLEMKMDLETILKTEDTHAKGEMNIEMMGSKIGTEIELYSVKEDDKYVTYMKAADQWTKEETDVEDSDSEDASTGDFEKIAEDIAKSADAFTLSEEKTEVDGKKCFELKGKIDGSEVSDLMEDEMMGDLSSAGMDSEALDEVTIPCTMEIYEEDLLPAKISFDMKSAMADMAEESGLEINEFYMDVTYVEFDGVGEIKVPKDVIEAVEDSDSGLSALYEDDSDSKEEKNDKDSDDKEKGKAKEPAKQSGELGKTWDSYTVQINDKVLTLPCTLAELESAGVTLDREYTPEDYVVNVEEYELAWFVDGNGNEITVEMVNMTDKPIALKDCVVGGISVDAYSVEEGGLTVIFPGGIQIGSTEADVLAAYGEPSDTYESEEYGNSFMWYDENSENYYDGCSIDTELETGLVDSMSLTHYE